MKKVFSLFLAITLSAIGFVSCSDDDDKVLIPTEQVQNISFTDTDYEEGKIGGTLSWTLPSSEENITGYVIYLSTSATEKGSEVETVKAGTTSYEIEAGTDYKAYIHIVVKNTAGEAATWASLAIRDNTSPVVTNLQFTDTDMLAGKIGGTVSWEAPEIEPTTAISGYTIYLSNDNSKKGEKMGEVTGNTTSYAIPDETPYQSFIQVAVIVNGKESEDFASIAVTDEYNVPTIGFYVLNRGNFNANNTKIGYYDFATQTYISDLFFTANGSGLGDSAQEMLIYGSKIYVTVYQSNTIIVMDLDGKLIKAYTPEHADPVNPRCLAAEDGKVFISYYKGHSVAVMDTTDLSIRTEIPVGRYPEDLLIANGKLYVANSGGLDSSNDYGYGKTVSRINLNTLSVEKDIEVEINPTLLSANSQGDVYVISMGNYGDIKNTLQRINKEDDTVDVLGNASIMSLVNDELYTVYAQWGVEEITFKKYDGLTGKLLENNFIKDGTAVPSPSSIDVDPESGEIYIGTYDYSSTSDLYIFSKDGKLTKSPFETEGYDVVGVYFRSQTVTE